MSLKFVVILGIQIVNGIELESIIGISVVLCKVGEGICVCIYDGWKVSIKEVTFREVSKIPETLKFLFQSFLILTYL